MRITIQGTEEQEIMEIDNENQDTLNYLKLSNY